jgi:hypothetical protein
LTITTATIQWTEIWYVWAIVGIGAALVYGAQRRTKVSGGTNWLKLRRAWVRTYDLTKVTAHSTPVGIELRFTDQGGRELSVISDEIQRDRYLWDLVYNGIVHSVIAGGAETNNLLHRAFQVPRPRPDSPR